MLAPLDAREDLFFAFAPVRDECVDVALRFDNRRTVRRPVERVVAIEQQREAFHVTTHVPVGRRNDAGGPAHHVVAREQRALFTQRKADVVRRVAGRVHALHRPAVRRNHLAMADPDVGLERHVGALFELHCRILDAGAVRTERICQCVAVLTKQRTTRGVVRVRMRDQHVADPLTLGCRKNGVDVVGIGRTGIDYRDIAVTEDVGARAVQREGTGILGDDPADQRRQLSDRTIFEFELAPKRDLHAHREIRYPRGAEA